MLRKILIGTGTIIGLPIGCLLLLLCFPNALFAYSVSAGDLSLYSDRPFTEQEGVAVLRIAAAKLAASPLYVGKQSHSVYVCNEPWRQRLFFTYVYGAGGVNYYPLTTNVFLRSADIAGNQLYKSDGTLVGTDRPLDYYIAHEITHTLAKRALGSLTHEQLPQWVREGYPDYVGKGAQFDYDAAVKLLLANDRSMNHQKSGLYLRFNLLVAHLLDKEKWSVHRLLTESIAQTEVEARVLSEAPSPAPLPESVQFDIRPGLR